MTSNPYNYSTNWTAKWTVQVACGSSSLSPCTYTIASGQQYTPNYTDQCTAIKAANITGAKMANIYCDQNTISPSTSAFPYSQFYRVTFLANPTISYQDASLNSIINFTDNSTYYRYSFPIALSVDDNSIAGVFTFNPFPIYPNNNPTTTDPSAQGSTASNNGFSIITATQVSFTPNVYFTINPGTYGVTINCLGQGEDQPTITTLIFDTATPTGGTLSQSGGYTQTGSQP
jgi:hypothetical protein